MRGFVCGVEAFGLEEVLVLVGLSLVFQRRRTFSADRGDCAVLFLFLRVGGCGAVAGGHCVVLVDAQDSRDEIPSTPVYPGLRDGKIGRRQFHDEMRRRDVFVYMARDPHHRGLVHHAPAII